MAADFVSKWRIRCTRRSSGRSSRRCVHAASAQNALYLQSLGAQRERDRFRLATWSLDGICEVDPESLIQGARTAQATGDLVLAQRLAQAAFDAQPIIETAELLGARQLATGDFESMKAHFARWDELVHTTAQRATYEEMFTQAWFWRGYDETMIHRLIVGLDGWPDEPSRQQAAVAASALLVSSGRIDEAVALVETVGDVTPGPTAVLAAMTLGHGWRAQGRPLAAEASVAAALDFYRSISVDAHSLSSVAMAGLHLQTLADAARFAELDRIVDDNSVGWHDLGDTSNLALANLAHGYSWLVRGDYPERLRWRVSSRFRTQPAPWNAPMGAHPSCVGVCGGRRSRRGRHGAQAARCRSRSSCQVVCRVAGAGAGMGCPPPRHDRCCRRTLGGCSGAGSGCGQCGSGDRVCARPCSTRKCPQGATARRQPSRRPAAR